jgi:23S rRNA (adenine2030-N6)-methyltransferase
MNYRHAFHAGNFADVVKHAVLARIVAHLRNKHAAFRVIDTHAGPGRTNLQGEQATRGGEWQAGIGRVFRHPFAPQVAALLEPYLSAIAAFNPDGALKTYPGSPLLVRHWLRPQDRLIACELERGAALALSRNLRGDARVKAIAIDGWTALNAYIPPKEKRGLVLIDPPYEQEDELQRAADALCAAHRKWSAGIILLWYPITNRHEIARFIRSVESGKPAKSLRMELFRTGGGETGLRGTGLIAVNAPWTLRDEAQILLPALARVFWPDDGSKALIEPIGVS